MIYDFHTHTSLSDGDLSPIEMVRRAAVCGYNAVALTDHAAAGDMERIVPELIQACALARHHWKILAVPGIELTHAPAKAIPDLAKKAKALGAWVVVVHGETIVEPVEPGTNLAAISCPDVDILAHPGFLTEKEARLAAEKGTFLEISARKGHSLTNGHVAQLARKAGARMLVDSDSHTDSDLLAADFAMKILQGAGVPEAECQTVLEANPQLLIQRLLSRNQV